MLSICCASLSESVRGPFCRAICFSLNAFWQMPLDRRVMQVDVRTQWSFHCMRKIARTRGAWVCLAARPTVSTMANNWAKGVQAPTGW